MVERRAALQRILRRGGTECRGIACWPLHWVPTEAKSEGVTFLWPSHSSTGRDAWGGGDVDDACGCEAALGPTRCWRLDRPSDDEALYRWIVMSKECSRAIAASQHVKSQQRS
jgi:hypothetical protein